MPLSSTPIQARTVIRSSSAPGDTDVLWLDETTSPATLKQFDAGVSDWVPVASSVVTRQDSEPLNPVFGDIWIPTTQEVPSLYVWDGKQFVDPDGRQTAGIPASDRDITTGPTLTGSTNFSQEWITVASGVGLDPDPTPNLMRLFLANGSGPRGVDGIRVTDVGGTQHTILDPDSGGFVAENTWSLYDFPTDSINVFEIRLNNGDPVQSVDVMEFQLISTP